YLAVLSGGRSDQSLPGARADLLDALARLRRWSNTNTAPSANGNKDMQTVGSSVLPPPPLPISFARIPALASKSETTDRSICVYLTDCFRSCGSSAHRAVRSCPGPGTQAR